MKAIRTVCPVVRGVSRKAVLRGFLWTAVAGWVLWSGASCALGSAARVRLRLPVLPGHWKEAFPGLTFLVVFPDPSGRTVTAAGAQDQVIGCSKAGNTPILAYPAGVAGEDEQGVPPGLLRPAGALYPLDLDQESTEPTISLTWEDGPLALLVSRLQAVGMEVALLNAGRLRDRLRLERDPWDLDLEAIAQELARGSFSAWDIDPLADRAVELRVGQGTWFLESPFASPIDVSASPELLLPKLSLGMHELFSTTGSWIRLYVQEREVTVMPRR